MPSPQKAGGAEHALAPQVHAQGPVPATRGVEPSEQRLVVGLVAVRTPFAVPQDTGIAHFAPFHTLVPPQRALAILVSRSVALS